MESPMYQLRVYTLRTPEGLAAYKAIWSKHIPSLAKHRITTHGVWTVARSALPQLYALVSYAEGDEPRERDEAYMSSADFQADMEGFDFNEMVGIVETLLSPTAESPLG
ncbi:NIPSNAP family protein [Streptomyces sp. NPDC051985]|uniref:NIPSNAP family protein n=1 Tax=Streptomyces sp. NPDC051985 TaxID=3155807 RepID=UPI00341CFCD7